MRSVQREAFVYLAKVNTCPGHQSEKGVLNGSAGTHINTVEYDRFIKSLLASRNCV